MMRTVEIISTHTALTEPVPAPPPSVDEPFFAAVADKIEAYLKSNEPSPAFRVVLRRLARIAAGAVEGGTV